MSHVPKAYATIVVEGNYNLSSPVPTDVFVEIEASLFPEQFPGGV